MRGFIACAILSTDLCCYHESRVRISDLVHGDLSCIAGPASSAPPLASVDYAREASGGELHCLHPSVRHSDNDKSRGKKARAGGCSFDSGDGIRPNGEFAPATRLGSTSDDKMGCRGE